MPPGLELEGGLRTIATGTAESPRAEPSREREPLRSLTLD